MNRKRIAGEVCLVGWRMFGALVLTLLFAAAALARTGPVPDSYIVLIATGDPAAVAGELVRAHGGRVVAVWKHGVAGFELAASSGVARRMARDPRVRLVEQNRYVELSASQSTRYNPERQMAEEADRLWHLDRIDQEGFDAAGKLDGKYEYYTTGEGVRVYVVDSGVFGNHPEFRYEGVEAGASFTGEPASYPANDPCFGWPEAVHDADYTLPAEAELRDHDRTRLINAMLSGGHGTSVASLVNGVHVGVAKSAFVVPVKVAPCIQYTARTWRKNRAYAKDRVVVGGNQLFLATQSGTSGSSEPAWPTTGTVVDGSVVWEAYTPPFHSPTVARMIQALAWILGDVKGRGLTAVINFSSYDLVLSSETSAFTAQLEAVLEAQIPIVASANNQNGDACQMEQLGPNPGETLTFELLPGAFSRGNARYPPQTRNAKVITVGGSMIVNNPERHNRGDGGAAIHTTEPRHDPIRPTRDARWEIAAGDSTGYLPATDFKQRTTGSNGGGCVTLFAPARNITSALLKPFAYRDGLGDDNDALYPLASGTSFSAPIVSGIVARILQAKPLASVDEIHRALVNNAVPDALDPVTLTPAGVTTSSPNLLARASDVVFVKQASRPGQTESRIDIARGASVTLDVEVIVPKACVITYQWYRGRRNGSAVAIGSPSTSPTLTETPADSAYYWVRVSGTCDGTPIANDSREVLVSLECGSGSIGPITASGNTLSVTAPGATAFAWYTGDVGDTSSTPIGTQASVTVNPANPTRYWVRAYFGSATCYRDVAAAYVFECVPIVFDEHPASDASAPVGGRTKLDVHLARAPQDVRFTWERTPAGLSPAEWTAVPGCVSSRVPTCDMPITSTEYKYRARATSALCGTSVYSNEATLTPCRQPDILSFPTKSLSAKRGSTVQLQAVISLKNSGVAQYTWYRGALGDRSEVAATGSVTATQPGQVTITTAVTIPSTSSFWLEVTDGCGSNSHGSVTVTCSDCRKRACCIGASAMNVTVGTTVVLFPPETGANLTYAWRVGAYDLSVAPFSTAASPSFTIQQETKFWCRVTDTSTGEHFDSDLLTITIRSSVGPSIEASPATMVRAGTAVTLVAKPDGARSYAWRDTLLSSQPPFAYGQTITVRPQQDTWYTVTVDDGASVQSSDPYRVRIECSNPFVSISATPNPPFLTSSDVVTLTANGGGNSLQYRWYLGNSGDTSQYQNGQWEFHPVVSTPSATYWVRAIDTCGQYADSAAVTLYLCVPAIDVQPHDVVVAPNTPASLTVHAVEAGGATPTYTWYRSTDTAMQTPLHTGATFTTTPASGSASYFAAVTTSCGSTPHRVKSQPATIDVCAAPVISSTTPGTITQPGQSGTATVTASGTDLSYQWYRGNTADVATSTLIAGATTNQLTQSPQTTTKYWCLVRSRGVCEMKSPVVAINVCAAAQVTDQPDSQSVVAGSTVRLEVAATEALGNALSYLWYKNEGSGWVAIATATQARYDVPSVSVATRFKVRITTQPCGNETWSAEAVVSLCPYPASFTGAANRKIAKGASTTLDLNLGGTYAPVITWYQGDVDVTTTIVGGPSVHATASVSPNVTTKYWAKVVAGGCTSKTTATTVSVCIPTITSHPQSLIAAAGTPVTLSVATNGTAGETIRWYEIVNGSHVELVGYTAASISGPATTTRTFFARVTGACGDSVDSNPATVTVCSAPQVTTGSSQFIRQGTAATVSVLASGQDLSYRWFTGAKGNTSAPVLNATASSLSVTPPSTTSYWAEVKSQGTCGTQSETITIDVCTDPVISAQPQSKTIVKGTTASLSVTASATTGSITYQWYERPLNGTWSLMSGKTASTLTTAALQVPMQYFVAITRGACTVNSAVATISVCTPPAVWLEVTPWGEECYSLQVKPTAGTLPDYQYHYYIGPKGNIAASVDLGTGSFYRNGVCPTSLPATFWVRVTTMDGLCSTDVSQTVP